MNGYCLEYNQEFELTPDLDYVHLADCSEVWCPVCLARGRRRLHIIWETWKPGFEYETTADEAVAR